ncbi:hypothetical protein [Devosia sp.]|uniref:hypothetical protein n=1 Tax=Devosia sp. TaxID=1871048 RepID=UPI003A9133F3
MDRLAIGLMTALFALLVHGGFVKDVLAEDTSRLSLSHGQAVPSLTNPPATTGSRSARVMSLLLTLEALRAAPELSVSK